MSGAKGRLAGRRQSEDWATHAKQGRTNSAGTVSSCGLCNQAQVSKRDHQETTHRW